MVPPSASRPWMRPSACSLAAVSAAPWAMACMAVFSSPLSITACSVVPAAWATSVWVMSTLTWPAASTPTSISSTWAPSACTRSRR